MSEPEFTVSVSDLGDAVALAAAGELDLAATGELQEAAADHLGRRLTLDLAEVSFIDSSGIRELLVLRKAIEEAGGSLELAALSKNVHQVLELVGVLSVFESDGAG